MVGFEHCGVHNVRKFDSAITWGTRCSLQGNELPRQLVHAPREARMSVSRNDGNGEIGGSCRDQISDPDSGQPMTSM